VQPGKRVLVVDDDPVIVRLLEVNFRLEGFEVATASGGDEAIELALERRPDIIVLDVMMPQVDGWEVVDRIRALPRIADVPILFLSARTSEEDRARGLALGVVDYVTKPFDPQDLTALVRRHLEGGG
jgi:two-component system OmpR family response regulator